MNGVLDHLRRELGDSLIPADAASRYETDYSIFTAEPLAVVRPQSIDEIRTTLRIGQSAEVPVTARAGGSNTGGSALGTGIILLFDHPDLATISVEQSPPRVRVGPAARHDSVQRALGEHSLWLPSDPSSGPLSRIGGNIATRASGPHALRHGSIAEYVRDIEFMCADGTLIEASRPESMPTSMRHDLCELSATIRSDLNAMKQLHAHEGQKWASGLDLLALVEAGEEPERALPRLLCGSVGALAIVTGVVLEPKSVPQDRVAVQIPFHREIDACRAALDMRDSADAVEFLSRESLLLLRKHSDTLLHTSGEAILIAEFSPSTDGSLVYPEVLARIESNYSLSSRPEVAHEPGEIDAIWKARKALLPIIDRVCRETGRHAHSVVNDVGVPPQRLPQLLSELRQIFAAHGLEVAVYGHAGSGNLHLRPLFSSSDTDSLFGLASDVYRCVTGLGGFVTAEHGLGPLRSPFMEFEWSERVIGYMRTVKSVFDPKGLLNPGALFPVSEGPATGWSMRLKT